MKQLWLKVFLGVFTVAGLSMGLFLEPSPADAYQGAATPPGVYIIVGNPPDGTNVRSGPSSVNYGPPIGHLNPGDTEPALGRTQGGDWIQIRFPSGPNGTGWVYSYNVEVAGGELGVVEAPPTPAPLMTATVDATLVAAFNLQPTQTRMPTFTPPPPLNVPQFTDASAGRSFFGDSGFFILGLGLIGAIGLLISFIWQKRS